MSPLPRSADRTCVMGILNVTPDSFSDGGLHLDGGVAVERARRMVDEGVDAIDVGGESTRPNAVEVSVEDELRRVVGVVERVVGFGLPVSIDTRKSSVAKAAVQAGACAVNDVSAGCFDPMMLEVVADLGVEFVAMHMRGSPQDMDAYAIYEDVVSEVSSELKDRVTQARTAGIVQDSIWIDPGLGFAKTTEQSLEIVARVDELLSVGHPVVVGPSRKRFVGEVSNTPVGDRLEATLAAVAWLAAAGVTMVRVHDVLAARRVVEMTAAIGRGKR